LTSFFGYHEEIIFVFGLQQLEYDVPRSGIFGIYPTYYSELLESVICRLSIILENDYGSLISASVDLGPVGCHVTAAL